jgi:hypothetical protein
LRIRSDPLRTATTVAPVSTRSRSSPIVRPSAGEPARTQHDLISSYSRTFAWGNTTRMAGALVSRSTS